MTSANQNDPGLTSAASKPAASRSKTDHTSRLRHAALSGVAVLALFGGTIGLWAATANISGAVVAPGQFVTETNTRKVQHQAGGIVGELKVREGDRVKERDLLIRLDETLTRANLQIITSQLDELMARSMRNEAERDNAASLKIPAAFMARQGDPTVDRLIESERTLFEARRSARSGQRSQLRQRALQSEDEIRGLQGQQAANILQISIIQRELIGVRELFARNLIQITRLSVLERDAAMLEGTRNQLIAQVAQIRGKISEIELQIIQIDEDVRAEAMRELRDGQGKIAELNERRVAAEDTLARVEIRSPADGFVHQLAVHTVGGVITPAEPIMMIVPTGVRLQLEARVMPQDIDQLRIGQPAVVRLHAFNQRTTPELNGTLTRVGADVSREANVPVSFYTIRITITDEEAARLGDKLILAGMTADVFIKTTDRTPLDFLIRPVKDQFARAFKER